MAEEPFVSVVVPHFEAPDDLARLVTALAVQTHPSGRTELVVADDGSREPPVLPPDLPFRHRVVRQEDRGFRASAARALGARHAEGAILVFLDGDMLPEPDYLARCAASAARSGDEVVVGRRRHVEPTRLPVAWAPGDPVPGGAALPDPAWLTDGYRASDDLRRVDATGYRFVISAVLTVARPVYEDAGGFDPGFVGYGGEDWELAHRLWRAGARFTHRPDAVAWHLGADLAGREDPDAAARLKAREALVLAPRITAPTARGLALAPSGAPGRVRLVLRAGGDAATVLAADALLQGFPSAALTVVGAVGPDARALLSDPRVRLVDDAPPVPAWPAAPDWLVEALAPVRPIPGTRADPGALSEALLAAERAGVEEVDLLDDRAARGRPEDDRGTANRGPEGDRATVLVRLTHVRASARRERGAAAGPTPLRRPLRSVGWEPVAAVPDLEAWWGGWG